MSFTNREFSWDLLHLNEFWENYVKAYVNKGYAFGGAKKVSDTITTSDRKMFYLLTEAGTYSNMSSSIVHQSGIGIALWNGTAWSYQNVPYIADATPTKGSTNPVQSGGVYADSQKTNGYLTEIIPILLDGYSITYSQMGYGTWYMTNGTTGTAQTRKVSGLIPVCKGMKFNCNLYSGSASVYVVAAFDFNKSLVSNKSIATRINGEYTVEEGVFYLQFQSYVSTTSTDNVELSHLSLSDLETELSTFDSQFATRVLAIMNGYETDVTGTIGDKYINKSTGIVGDSASYKCSEQIAVTPGEKYKIISGAGSTTWLMMSYDSSNNPLLNLTDFNIVGDGTVKTYNITIPSGVSFIVVESQNSITTRPYVYKVVDGYIKTTFPNKSTTDKFSEVDGQLLWDNQPIASESISTLVVDLPISDGTDVSSGYAYIDSTTYSIKVKQ